MSIQRNDMHNNVKVQRVIAPVAIGANATKSGKVIDRQGYGGVEFVGVQDVALNQAHDGGVEAVEVGAEPGGEIVEGDDLGDLVGVRHDPGEIRPDESGTAGDQYRPCVAHRLQ